MEEEWTYWDNITESYTLKSEIIVDKKPTYWSLIDRIGELEAEIRKLNAKIQGWNVGE